jgi:hypothetical protein
MNSPGEKQSYRSEILVLLIAFLLSRTLVAFSGIHFKYQALYVYWQYLDTETLRHHLLQGLWYDHSQPPLFNLLLGLVLKLAGSHAPLVFSSSLHLISLVNCLLLFTLLKRTVPNRYIPVIVTLVYLLSPALMILESELFYTTFISMLLLIGSFFLVRLDSDSRKPPVAAPAPHASRQWGNVIGVCLPLLMLCLTRSMYHLLWLILVGAVLLYRLRKSAVFPKLLAGLSFCLLLTAGWYGKNYVVFGQFAASSWIGMNFARVVFYDHYSSDSSRIEAIEPFSDLRYYRSFIHGDDEKKFAGLDDRDLIQKEKNDSFRNLNQVEYLEISRQYMAASKAYVKARPFTYLGNVLKATIIFFAPATRYPYAEPEAAKIRYYDLFYSFNLSQLAKGLQQRRIALTLSAIPKMLVYMAVFWILLKDAIRRNEMTLLNLFIFGTIGFVFLISSLIEHYENMRFRYEIEPLFLVLLGQALATWRRPVTGNI